MHIYRYCLGLLGVMVILDTDLINSKLSLFAMRKRTIFFTVSRLNDIFLQVRTF